MFSDILFLPELFILIENNLPDKDKYSLICCSKYFYPNKTSTKIHL